MSDEFGSLIGLNLFLLKLCGVIPHRGRLIARNILAFVMLFCLSLYSTAYMYVLVVRDAQLDEKLEIFALMITIMGGQARFIILLVSCDRCQRMLNTCELLWSALNPNEKKIVESYAKKTSRLTLYYLSTCIVTVLVYCMAVLLVSSTQNNLSDINDDSKNATNASLNLERHLPYVFFVEIQETPWYELVFVFEIVCMMNVGIACVGTDTLGVLFTLIACGHFDVIKSRMEGVTVEVETTSGRRWLSHSPSANIATAEAPSKEQIDSFRVCVVHHQILLGLCEELQDLTSMQLLVQLLGSTYNISLAGFKLVGDDPGKFKFIMQLLVLLFQLFMCNWPADVLSTKSEAACQAAYSAPWYQYPSWLRKPVNLMLVRTQRPARLTAGKYIVLSLETFKAMISSAVSFFTVVKSMN